MKLKRVLVTSVLVVFLAAGSLVLGSGQPVAAAGATIFLNPPTVTILPGHTGVQTVQIADALGVYGVQFTISFDPTLLQVVDANSTAVGVQIGFPEDTYFEGKDYFVGRNWVNNTTGLIEFAATLYQPAAPIDGCAVIAKITWQAIAAGWSPIEFEDAKLVDMDGIELPVAVGGGAQAGSDTRPPISGRVKLQGRSAGRYGGTLVALSEEPCLPAAPTRTDDKAATRGVNIIPDMPYVYTDSNGDFTITPYADHDYRCLLVFKHGYLSGQAALPRGGFDAPHDLGTITLLGGDVNEDDVVNIFDLVKVASHMSPGPYDEVADINLDRVIDIGDLAITAGNFGFRGPLNNWVP